MLLVKEGGPGDFDPEDEWRLCMLLRVGVVAKERGVVEEAGKNDIQFIHQNLNHCNFHRIDAV